MALISKDKAEDKEFYLELLETIEVIARSKVGHTEQAEKLIKDLYESAEKLKHKIDNHDYTEDDERRARFDALFRVKL
jgi:hypothetical protein